MPQHSSQSHVDDGLHRTSGLKRLSLRGLCSTTRDDRVVAIADSLDAAYGCLPKSITDQTNFEQFFRMYDEYSEGEDRDIVWLERLDPGVQSVVCSFKGPFREPCGQISLDIDLSAYTDWGHVDIGRIVVMRRSDRAPSPQSSHQYPHQPHDSDQKEKDSDGGEQSHRSPSFAENLYGDNERRPTASQTTQAFYTSSKSAVHRLLPEVCQNSIQSEQLRNDIDNCYLRYDGGVVYIIKGIYSDDNEYTARVAIEPEASGVRCSTITCRVAAHHHEADLEVREIHYQPAQSAEPPETYHTYFGSPRNPRTVPIWENTTSSSRYPPEVLDSGAGHRDPRQSTYLEGLRSRFEPISAGRRRRSTNYYSGYHASKERRGSLPISDDYHDGSHYVPPRSPSWSRSMPGSSRRRHSTAGEATYAEANFPPDDVWTSAY